jgi:rhamnose transport system permease protein
VAHDSLYTEAPDSTPDRSGRSQSGWLSRLRSRDAVVLAAVLVVLIGASVLVDGFASQRNAQFLLIDVIPIALIALPMTFIIITGEIDLSVASTLGLCSAVMGHLWASGLSLELIVVLVVLLGAVLGAVNGIFVTVFGLPSLAVTIGTLALYRGLAFVVLGDQAVADFPVGWTSAATSTVGGWLPIALLPVLLLAAVFGVVLHATPVGRELYAIGNNTEASTFTGVSVARTKLWLFVISGAVAALAGVFWTLRYASARADNGVGLELAVIAAVLLGGVSIFGGLGSLPGVLGGVLLLASLRNGLQLADVSADALTIVTGSLLILSVVAPNVLEMTRARLRRRRRLAESSA